jgi:hypothetical protein
LTPLDYQPEGGRSDSYLLYQAQNFEPEQKLGMQKFVDKIRSLAIEGQEEYVMNPEATGVGEVG